MASRGRADGAHVARRAGGPVQGCEAGRPCATDGGCPWRSRTPARGWSAWPSVGEGTRPGVPGGGLSDSGWLAPSQAGADRTLPEPSCTGSDCRPNVLCIRARARWWAGGERVPGARPEALRGLRCSQSDPAAGVGGHRARREGATAWDPVRSGEAWFSECPISEGMVGTMDGSNGPSASAAPSARGPVGAPSEWVTHTADPPLAARRPARTPTPGPRRRRGRRRR